MYSPLNQDPAGPIGQSFGDAKDVPDAGRDGWGVQRVGIEVQGIDLGRVLVAKKTFDTARGKVTVSVFLKVEAGAAGDVPRQEAEPEALAALALRNRLSLLRDQAGAAALVNAVLAAPEGEDQTELFRAAGEALGDVGAPAVPVLLPLLEREDLATWACEVLGSMRAEAAGALDALSRRLGAEDHQTREVAARTLGQIGPAASQAVGALRGRLADADRDVRAEAATALGAVGPGAAVALDDLVGRLSDPSEARRVRDCAARSLGALGDPRAVLPLARALADRDVDVRTRAAAALGELGTASAPAVPALVAALDPKDGRTCAATAEALGRIGPGASFAVTALEALVGNPDANVSSTARVALARIRPARR